MFGSGGVPAPPGCSLGRGVSPLPHALKIQHFSIFIKKKIDKYKYICGNVRPGPDANPRPPRFLVRRPPGAPSRAERPTEATSGPGWLLLLPWLLRKRQFFEEKLMVRPCRKRKSKGSRLAGHYRPPRSARRFSGLDALRASGVVDLARLLAVGMWEPGQSLTARASKRPPGGARHFHGPAVAVAAAPEAKLPCARLGATLAALLSCPSQAARAQSARRVEWAPSPNGLSNEGQYGWTLRKCRFQRITFAIYSPPML